MNDWNALRKFYKNHMDEIMDSHPSQYGIDLYWWEDMVEMTPIERGMWCDIRCAGVVMYPQFPILNVFVDFANPHLKIAIECDGKQWHDPVKDAERDARLNAIGWTVYRFTGSECKKTGKEYEDDIGRIKYQLSSIEQLMAEIREECGKTPSGKPRIVTASQIMRENPNMFCSNL